MEGGRLMAPQAEPLLYQLSQPDSCNLQTHCACCISLYTPCQFTGKLLWGCRTPHPLTPSFSQFRPQCIKNWNGEPAWALKPATFPTYSLYGLEQIN